MMKFYWKHIDYCLDYNREWHFKVPMLLDETAIPAPTAHCWQGFKEIETCPDMILYKRWRHWYLRPVSGNFGNDERLVDNVPYLTKNEYYEEADNPLTLDVMIKKFSADKVIQYCVERGMALAVK